MRVAITGALGGLGKAVVSELTAHGHHVIAVDRLRSDGNVIDAAEFRVADLTNLPATLDALAEADAVCHLAAIPNPVAADGPDVIANNVSATFNVIHAAVEVGIKRIVYTSSQSALGNPWAPQLQPLQYVPVDEEHPCQLCDPYGLSKLIGEQICDMFARTSPLQVTSLRLPAIWSAEHFAERTKARLSDPVQAAKSMWAYVDLRDAARAHRLALQVDWEGHEVVNVTTRWAFTTEPISELLPQWYPKVTDLRVRLEQSTPVFDCRKADRLLDFRSRYRWTTTDILDCDGEASS